MYAPMSDSAHAGYAADRNLLFGVLALQADLLDAARFAEACSAWAARKGTPLADLLVEHGWLCPEERSHVEFLLGRKLQKHSGDAAAGLAEVIPEGVRQTLADLDDPVVRQTPSAAAPSDGVHEQKSVAYRPAGTAAARSSGSTPRGWPRSYVDSVERRARPYADGRPKPTSGVAAT
jgi:hypothetical protein